MGTEGPTWLLPSEIHNIIIIGTLQLMSALKAAFTRTQFHSNLEQFETGTDSASCKWETGQIRNRNAY